MFSAGHKDTGSASPTGEAESERANKPGKACAILVGKLYSHSSNGAARNCWDIDFESQGEKKDCDLLDMKKARTA